MKTLEIVAKGCLMITAVVFTYRVGLKLVDLWKQSPIGAISFAVSIVAVPVTFFFLVGGLTDD